MTGPLSRTALTAVIGVVAASLAMAAALTVFGDDLGAKPSAGADGYSVSAIGHQGLVRLLEKLDVPVVVSRSDSAERAQHGLLIVAEPTVTGDASRERLAGLIAAAPRALVVLPKWYGSAERGKTWIADASALPLDEVTAVLDALSLDGAAEVRRAPAAVEWDPSRIDRFRSAATQGSESPCGEGSPCGDLPPGRTRPVIREPQLIATEALDPIVVDRAGHVLVGQAEQVEGVLTVLADPDVLNNFGLRRPENARFTIELIDRLRGGGPVVIDETMHGYAQPPSLVRTLLQFPLVLATLQVLVCAVLVVWAAMVRFGPRRAAPPPIAPGKDFLIRNTAALLHYGGHHAHALRRYLALTVAAVRHALHAPALAPGAMTAWLERVRAARGGRISLAELEQAVETADTPAQVVELADQVFRWRMEMTHGARDRS